MTQRGPGPQHPTQNLIPVLGALIEQSRKREQGHIEALGKQLAGLQQLNQDCSQVARMIQQDPEGLKLLREQFDSFKAIVDEERAYHQGCLEHERLVQENLKAWIGALMVRLQPQRPMPPQGAPQRPQPLQPGLGSPYERFAGGPPLQPSAPQGMRPQAQYYRPQPPPGMPGATQYRPAPPQPLRPQQVMAHEPLAAVVPPSAFAAYRKKTAVAAAPAAHEEGTSEPVKAVAHVNGASANSSIDEGASSSSSDIVTE